MAEHDRRGLVLGTASPDAATHYREGVELFLRGQPGASTQFRAATGADPSFGEAYVGHAFSSLYDGDMAAATRSLAAASPWCTSPRQRGQAAMVHAVSQLDVPSIDRLARAHLEEYPTDDLAREAVGLTYFFVGRSADIVELYDWLAPTQHDDWGFAASWSFACHEVGRLEEARALGQAALAARPDHVFATHSLTHVAYETGLHADGAELVRSFFAEHDALAFQRRHLHWHLSLHLLALGHEAEASSLWAGPLHGSAVPEAPGSVEDGAGLLWRWHLYGCTGWDLPWEAVAEPARLVASLPAIPLPAVCAAVILAAVGDQDSLTTLRDTATSMAAAGLPVPADLVGAVADAASASFVGDWDSVVGALLPVHHRFAAIGGSRAQREVFEDALLFGLVRSGRGETALPMIEARVARRPSVRDRELMVAARQ